MPYHSLKYNFSSPENVARVPATSTSPKTSCFGPYLTLQGNELCICDTLYMPNRVLEFK